MGGGEPRAVTDLPKGAANPVWSPDGKTIAFSSSTRPDELTPKPVAKPEETPHQSDVRVITQAAYRANGVAGSGFVDSDRPGQIWTVAVPASGAPPAAPKRLTSGEFSASNHAVVYRRNQDLLRLRSPPRVVLLRERQRPLRGSPRMAGSHRGSSASRARSAPTPSHRTASGSRSSAPSHGEPERSYSQPDLWVVDRTRRHAAQPDRDLRLRRRTAASAATSARRAARCLPDPSGRRDGAASSSRSASRATPTSCESTPPAGRSTPLTKGDQEIMSATRRTPAATRLAVVRSRPPRSIGDLEVVADRDRQLAQKLTRFNDALFAQLDLTAAGGDLVHELRRQEDPGLDSEAAGVRRRRTSIR